MSSNFVFPKIYFFGDSVTKQGFAAEGCWASIIADAFQRKADVIVRGLSGYNSRMARVILPYLKKDLEGVSVAAVFFGANDAKDPNSTPHHISVQEYKDNLRDIIHQFKEAGVKVPMVITPPVRNLELYAKLRPDFKYVANSKVYLADYAEACLQLSKEENIPCVDLYHAMIKQDDWKGLLSDGIHLNERGSRLVASEILQVLQDSLNGVKEGSTFLWPDRSELFLLDAQQLDEYYKNWLKEYDEQESSINIDDK